jgi:hypothetical protein
MFKKTLLAASILGGASFAANAAQITVSVDETTAPTAIDAAATATPADACTTAATTLGVSVDLATFTLTAAGSQTVNVTNSVADGALTAASSVVLTANDVCDVTVAETLVGASSAKYSAEGAAANGVVLDVDLVTGIGGIQAEQTITFTVVGGTIDESLSAGATLVSEAATIAGTTGDNAFTLNGVPNPTTILFSANSTYLTPAVQREILSLAGVAVIPNPGVTEVKLSAVTRNTTGLEVDNADDEAVTNIDNQYSVAVTAALDGIIDVSDERLSLVVNDDDNYNSTAPGNVNGTPTPGVAELANTDTLVVKVNVETTQGNLVPASADLVIKGDFGWMANFNTDDTTPITSTELANGVAYASSADYAATPAAGSDTVNTATDFAMNAEYDELTISITPGITAPATAAELDPYHTITLTVPGDQTLNQTDFLATLTTSDGATGSAVVVPADTKVGEWTLNGSIVTIPYMPFGPNTKVILRHTSTSNQIGDITVRYILEDLDPANGDNWVSVGTVVTDVANGVLDIRDAVMDAIEADTGLDKGKVAIEITTNVPAEDVTVYAAYNVKNSADDRGFVGTFGKLGSAGVPPTM